MILGKVKSSCIPDSYVARAILLSAFLGALLLTGAQRTTNPMSRWVAIKSLAVHFTPRIDPYVNETIDWSQTPDGHYYSNKAPGPILIGAALYAFLDPFLIWGSKSVAEQQKRRDAAAWGVLFLFSLLFQAIPFVLVVGFWLRKMEALNFSGEAIAFAAVAALFGNTASLFMSTYFGHGFSAVWALVFLTCLYNRNAFWSGFSLGLLILSDYASVPLLFFSFAWLFASQTKSERIPFLKLAILGGLIPAILWIGYHTYCFGGPFKNPQEFINPFFKANANTGWSGAFANLPKLSILFELVFGAQRGLFFTQAWLLLILPIVFFGSSPHLRSQGLPRLWVVYFLSLLMINATFLGWHGGSSPGPRYLSSALPVFGILSAFFWDSLSRWVKNTLWVALTPSVLLYIVSMAGYFPPPEWTPLWHHYLTLICQNSGAQVRILYLIAVFTLVIGWGLWRERVKNTRPRGVVISI